MNEYDVILAGFAIIEAELKRIQGEMDEITIPGSPAWNSLAAQKSNLHSKLATMLNDVIGTL